MPTLDAVAVARLALGAGLSEAAAVIAVAVARGESQFRTDVEGDVTIQDATWGPSIGLWQIRSLKAQYGTGGVRDAARLKEPSFNAASMAAISRRGSYWQPWSVYTKGVYRQHLAEAERAVEQAAGTAGSWWEAIVTGALGNPVVGAIGAGATLGANIVTGSGTAQQAAQAAASALDWLNPQRILYVLGGAVLVIVGVTIAAQEFKVGERLTGAVPGLRAVRALT
jgi:hypothetical protein